MYQETQFDQIEGLISSGLILLVTATETETRALHKKMTSISKEGFLLEVRKDNNTYYIGRFGNYAVAHVECGDMGSTSSAGAIITINNAITHIKPKFVLMIGIAFGIDQEKQNIGDVLVSKKIIPYEIQRIGDKKITWRGSRPEASNSLRNIFKNIKDWNYTLPNDKKAKLSVCDILSGEKLVDNIDFRNQLIQNAPDAKGGEMEGTGLYAACHDKNISWILVKSICDFADGDKGTDKKQKQALAIETALSACLYVFNKKYVFEDLGITIPELIDPLIVNKQLQSIKKTDYINLLESDDIVSLFEQLNCIKIQNVYQYNRFKKEYQAGLNGIDLIDWKDRMKVFLNELEVE